MSWKTIMKVSEEEAARGEETQMEPSTGPARQELSQAGVRISAGTYKDLLNEVGQLWVKAKTANVMEQKILFGQMRKAIREANIPEA